MLTPVVLDMEYSTLSVPKIPLRGVYIEERKVLTSHRILYRVSYGVFLNPTFRLFGGEDDVLLSHIAFKGFRSCLVTIFF